YSVLSDPDTRRRYDRFGPDFRQIPEGYEAYADAPGAGERGPRGGSPFGGGRVWVDSSGGGPGLGGVDFGDLFSGRFRAWGAGGLRVLIRKPSWSFRSRRPTVAAAAASPCPGRASQPVSRSLFLLG